MCGILLMVEPGASAGQQVRILQINAASTDCRAALPEKCLVWHYLQTEYYEAGLKSRGPDHLGAVRVRLLLLTLL
jgi:hypothetical protein